MKKCVTLLLALSLLLSLGVNSFALENGAIGDINLNYFVVPEDETAIDMSNANPDPVYGDTVYYPLLTYLCTSNSPTAVSSTSIASTDAVVNSNAVKSVSVKQSWDEGKSYVESVSVVKKKADFSSGNTAYGYFVAVKLKSSKTTAENDVMGTVTLKKSAGGDWAFDELSLDVNLLVQYPTETDSTIYTTPHVHEFDSFDGEEDFSFDCGSGYFTVNASGQSNTLISVDNEFDEDIAALYPQANLEFINGNYATFNRSGTITIFADEGAYLYEIGSDGTISRIRAAEYDDGEEAFSFKTRILGRYIISDVSITAAAGSIGTGTSVVTPPAGTGTSIVTPPTSTTIIAPSVGTTTPGTTILKPVPTTGV